MKLTDPAHGGKCDIAVKYVKTKYEGVLPDYYEYEAPFVHSKMYDDGECLIREPLDSDDPQLGEVRLHGRSIYDLYLILKNILEKHGYALDNPF